MLLTSFARHQQAALTKLITAFFLTLTVRSKNCIRSLYFLQKKLLILKQLAQEEVLEVEGDGLERSCDTLIMCILTTLNNGLRNGGGIGDVLRKPSSSVCLV